MSPGQDASAPDRNIARHGVDQGCLSGAVGADQPGDLGWLDGECDIVEDVVSAEGDSDPENLKRALAWGPCLVRVECDRRLGGAFDAPEVADAAQVTQL